MQFSGIFQATSIVLLVWKPESPECTFNDRVQNKQNFDIFKGALKPFFNEFCFFWIYKKISTENKLWQAFTKRQFWSILLNSHGMNFNLMFTGQQKVNSYLFLASSHYNNAEIYQIFLLKWMWTSI